MRYVDKLVESAKRYDKRLNNKDFLVVYQENREIKAVHVGFKDVNFLHLTGITTELSAKQFYSACVSGKISEKDFSVNKKGFVEQKLAVLPYLPDLFYYKCMIGNFVNSGIYIKADYFIGNTKAVLSVGFRYRKNVDFPVTLYKDDVKKLGNPLFKVIAIFSKGSREIIFNTCTYLSKGQDIDKIKSELSRNASFKFEEEHKEKYTHLRCKKGKEGVGIYDDAGNFVSKITSTKKEMEQKFGCRISDAYDMFSRSR